MYPIRKSNKPPYIYAGKLIVIGLTLLLITLPLAVMATKFGYAVRYSESGEINSTTASIPRNTPPASILASTNYFITNLSLRSTSVQGCKVIVTVKGTNVTLKRMVNVKWVGFSFSGMNFFAVTATAGCRLKYVYKLIEVYRPYGYLAFISIFTSISGAVSGILGVTLWIKRRKLIKEEEKYLP